MAQDAEGPRDGGRSAAGPHRAETKGHQPGRAGDGGPKDRSATPSVQGAGKDASQTLGKDTSGARKQGQSSRNGGGDGEGQQSGRKRRRSRGRQNRSNRAGNVETQVGAMPKTQEIRERGAGEGPAAGSVVVSAGIYGSEQAKSGSAQTGEASSESREKGKNRSRRRSRSGRQKGRRDQASITQPNGNQSKEAQQKAPAANEGGQDRNRVSHKSDQKSDSRRFSKADNAKRDDNRDRGKPERAPRKQPQSQNQGQGKAARRNGSNGQAARTSALDGIPRDAYAALDLGTNNCRLLVAEPHGQSFRVVDAFSRIVRLGEGLSQTGRLSDEAQERAIAALKVCQSKLSYRSVKRLRLIATEACRRASNGAAFLGRVHRETGLKLEIVDRETEARLAVAGCASLVHPEADGVVLFDIGGGSSEIVWLDLDPVSDEITPQPGEKRNRQTRRALRHLSERIRCWTSLQVGVVTLSEKHGGQVVTREHFEAMVADVREMLHQFEEREALAKAIESKHIHMLGTSGTVTTLAGVYLGLERYDRRQVDGTWLTAAELRGMIMRVLEMDFEERINNPCIGQDRADLVLAGCAILEAFHREWPCSQLRVADRGLREGILMEMMIDDGVWNPQSSNKPSGKKRRPRRRGGRGHRGSQNAGQGQKAD